MDTGCTMRAIRRRVVVTTCLDCNCALPPGDPANATDDHGDDRHNSADAWGEKWPGAYGLTAKQAAKQAAKKA